MLYIYYMSKDTDGLITLALKEALNEYVIVDDENSLGVKMKRSELFARNMLQAALFDASPQVRAIFSRLILEYTEGKPAVKQEHHQQQLPPITLNIMQYKPSEKEEMLKNAKTDVPPDASILQPITVNMAKEIDDTSEQSN